MNEEKTVIAAKFNPRVCTYWLISTTVVLTLTVIGIPFLLLWLPLGLFLTRRYLSRMECILTEKDLKVNKGMFVRVEKTIPLDKITDLGMVQGPIMRHFDIHQITVETAGQSSQGPLVALTGIVNVKQFRELVLKQRDILREGHSTKQPAPAEQPIPTDDKVLVQIKDALLRIEQLLKKPETDQ